MSSAKITSKGTSVPIQVATCWATRSSRFEVESCLVRAFRLSVHVYWCSCKNNGTVLAQEERIEFLCEDSTMVAQFGQTDRYISQAAAGGLVCAKFCYGVVM